jgi:hypothetical protein
MLDRLSQTGREAVQGAPPALTTADSQEKGMTPQFEAQKNSFDRLIPSITPHHGDSGAFDISRRIDQTDRSGGLSSRRDSGAAPGSLGKNPETVDPSHGSVIISQLR